jgi:hypothetical protein
MTETLPKPTHYKPAYKLTCGFWSKTRDGKDVYFKGCGRSGKLYFDRPIPESCHECGSKNLKIESLQTGKGYNHATDRPKYSILPKVRLQDM